MVNHKAVYQPDRKHVVYLECSPNAGTEQGGRRPALVLSPKDFNIATGLFYVCPITSKIKGGSFEVPIPRGTKLEGVILSDQMRSLDWIARKAEFYAEVSEDVMCEVLGRIEAILSIECT